MRCKTGSIGPAGITARLVLGLVLIVLAIFWRDPEWGDVLLGLVLLPAISIALFSWRARRSPSPLRATGPIGHLVNAAVFVSLFLIPATAGAAFLFYGSSMVVAARRRAGGCEITAISNAVLERNDQIGCMVFAPIDIAEARLRRDRVAKETNPSLEGN
jgi:hypothetical protein